MKQILRCDLASRAGKMAHQNKSWNVLDAVLSSTLNYWLGYLDLVFFYKYMKGDIIFAQHMDEYFSFLSGCSHHTSTV